MFPKAVKSCSRKSTITPPVPSLSLWSRLGEKQHSALADLVIYFNGTTRAAPVADELRTAGFNVDVIGDAGALNCIHGAVHSAWKATAKL